MKVINFLIVVFTILSCTTAEVAEEVENTPAAGFNMEESDAKAIAIADQVMEAMGGRRSWDNTKYICWNFFGARELIWDKHSGDVRINSMRDSSIYLINIFNNSGRVMRKGVELTDPDSIQKYVDRGKRIWINDSYWLVMPYKLKDSGVTLTWEREEMTESGLKSDVLQLEFENVGVTPDNWYEVWVDQESHLVRQWAYYRHDTLQEPGFVRPMDEWEQKGNILLSGNRGDRSITDIMVLESLPSHTFSSFEPVILVNN